MGYILNKKDTKFRVCNVIRKFLLENKTLQLLIGNRIYPAIAIEGVGDGDFILYRRGSYSLQKTKQGIYEQDCEVFIICVSADYDTSQEIAEQVYITLQDVHNYIDQDTGIVINKIDMTDSTEEYLSDRFVQVLKFKID